MLRIIRSLTSLTAIKLNEQRIISCPGCCCWRRGETRLLLTSKEHQPVTSCGSVRWIAQGHVVANADGTRLRLDETATGKGIEPLDRIHAADGSSQVNCGTSSINQLNQNDIAIGLCQTPIRGQSRQKTVCIGHVPKGNSVIGKELECMASLIKHVGSGSKVLKVKIAVGVLISIVVFYTSTTGHNVAPQNVLADCIMSRINRVRHNAELRWSLLIVCHDPFSTSTCTLLDPFQSLVEYETGVADLE
jgi:hypothetical protein